MIRILSKAFLNSVYLFKDRNSQEMYQKNIQKTRRETTSKLKKGKEINSWFVFKLQFLRKLTNSMSTYQSYCVLINQSIIGISRKTVNILLNHTDKKEIKIILKYLKMLSSIWFPGTG